MKHQIKPNKYAHPFRRIYWSMSFDKRKAIKKIVEDLEYAKFIEPAHSYREVPSIFVKKRWQLQTRYRTHSGELSKLFPWWQFPTLETKLPFRKKTTESRKTIRFCSTNKIKCPNTEIVLSVNICVGLIDSWCGVLLLSCYIYKKLGEPGIVQIYTKWLVTAIESAVKITVRVTLLVQFKLRIAEVEHELVITADEVIECLLGIDFLKTNKCVLSVHEEKIYISQLNI